MKGDADQLIAEANKLLRENSGSRRKGKGKIEGLGSEQKPERSLDIDKAEIDSKRGMSSEQIFWFKLAESVVRRSE